MHTFFINIAIYLSIYPESGCSEMVIAVGNGHGEPSSNLDEAVCISYKTNTFGKGMNSVILPSVMGK